MERYRTNDNASGRLANRALSWVNLIAVLLLAACCWSETANAEQQEYTLDTGDRVRVTVFGHDDLSAEIDVGSNGTISLPLIGEVHAAGVTLSELERVITSKLKPDYLKDPQVTVEVVNYRPFYIIGEVQNPGTYPYVGGMRVVNAVAMAGGFTYRARKDEMRITRADGDGQPVDVGPDAMVFPGDVVTILERFF